MTLPLRKKLPTTAKNTRPKTTVISATATSRSWLTAAPGLPILPPLSGPQEPSSRLGRLLRLRGCAWWAVAALRPSTLGFMALSTLLSSSVQAQQPSWQPTRLPSQSDARPLNVVALPAASHAAPAASQTGGIVLRWKSVSNGPAAAGAHTPVNSTGTFTSSSSAPTAFNPSNSVRTVQPAAAAQPVDSAHPAVSQASGWNANPLRSERAVRTANYQQPLDPFGDKQPVVNEANIPALPPSIMPALPPAQFLPKDPLSGNEQAPAPGIDQSQPEQVEPLPVDPPADARSGSEPFGRRLAPKSDPFGDREPAQSSSDQPDKAGDKAGEAADDLKMPKRNKNANTNSCNELRDRVRQLRLSDISLDVSPGYGEGLRAKEGSSTERLDFAASAPVRDWTDYTGAIVATGRLVDLRNDRAVLDVSGREQSIPLRDLSDIDIAYVAEAWKLPLRCGIGYEAYAGRQFIPSAVEWKAFGLCHKPLYFEDVQLERYGHEVGPVLQPLLSSAHFFGNTLILPYKMGIHPPGECQYPLGYYRPGNCAPYMIQPFPFSLRGAAVQAGFVSGAAALIP